MKALSFYFILISIVVISLQKQIMAQTDYNKINIATPNAASLGKFVDVPINYHTGIPQINIPLYSLIDGKLELPISLSYHAGGIKVEESASWVGAGWALNAGGVITRTVRGIPDEANNTNRGIRGYFSHYGYNSYYAENLTSNALTDIAVRDNEIQNGIIDGEPDLFFFNFSGHSGKFYFNDDRTPVLVAGNEDLKIDYFYGLPATPGSFLDKNIQGFCITIGDGTKYFFGKTTTGGPDQGATPIEISIPFDFSNGLSSDRVVSSWYLSKIESADKSSLINLFYEAETYGTYSWSYHPIFDNVTEVNKGYSLSKLFFSGVRLSSIVSSNGKVVFSTSEQPRLDLAGGNFTSGSPPEVEQVNTSAKALKDISIISETRLLKKISFYSSYFNDTATPLPSSGVNVNLITDTKRLRLDSMKQIGGDGYALKPYKFEYYGNFLPRRLSFAIDHWGYYNGASNNGVLPKLTRDTYNVLYQNGANRESSWPSMQAGTLTKITYPTGGYTNFEFEANRAKVDAVRYDLVYNSQYSVGFSGSYSQEFLNVPFTGNEKYELTFVNTNCATGISNCVASYTIYNSSGNLVTSGSAASGKIEKLIATIPAGAYKIRLYRDGAYSGTGATLTISKFVPQQVLDPIIGGLRIKRLTKVPLTAATTIDDYGYEDAGRSSGVLYVRPYYISSLRSDMVARLGLAAVGGEASGVFPEGCIYFPGASGIPVVISPSSILPMSSIQGSHMGYGTVKVSQNSNGYSLYKFYIPNVLESNVNDVAYRNVVSNFCDPKGLSFPIVPSAFEFEKGELKSEYFFDGAGQLLNSASYKYSFDSTKVYTPAIIVKTLPQFAYTFAEYKLRGYWKKYVVKNEFTIDKKTLVSLTKIDTTFFSSANHRQPTRIVTEQSTGAKVVSNYKYIADFRLPATDAISDGWTTYNNDCNNCYTEYLNKISAPSSTPGSKKMDFHIYRRCLAIARKNYVNYRVLNFTGVVNSFDNAHLNAKNNASAELKPILGMQDQFINLPIEITEFNNNKLTSATFNSFSFESNTTNIFLESINFIPLNVSVSGFLSSTNTNSSLTKDSRYTKKFIFKSSNGNIVEQSKANGPKEIFLWGYRKKLPIAKVLNGDYQTIIASLNQAILDNPTTEQQLKEELNRIKSLFPETQLTSYTYQPLVGITSMTDTKGMVTYYEYDEFQRLKFIKDQNGSIVKSYQYNP